MDGFSPVSVDNASHESSLENLAAITYFNDQMIAIV
jgi:hypothetical protein